jgi:hypothetical protein
MSLSELILMFSINIVFSVSMIYYVLGYYRRKNVEWRDIVLREVKDAFNEIRDISHSVKNNIRSSLITVLSEELKDFSNSTKIENSFKSYLRSRITDYSIVYTQLKEFGIGILSNENVSSHLIGKSTLSTELLLLNTDFPVAFMQNINKVNEKNYNDFLKDIQIQLIDNQTDNKILLIKSSLMDAYRSNVRAAYKLFKNTQHLITTDDYVEMYGKREDGRYTQKQTGIDKNFLKDLITSGKRGFEKALCILKESAMDDDKRNELIIYMNRFSNYTNANRLNTSDTETDFNKLCDAVLTFIDNL